MSGAGETPQCTTGRAASVTRPARATSTYLNERGARQQTESRARFARPSVWPLVTSSASPSATPDPEEAKRVEQEQRLRAEVAAAKARADALAAQVNSECPDLKPGELRHPGAAARCDVLKDQAAEAARQYELGKREAQAAGITVQ